MRVLVVEDEPDIAQQLKRALTHAGFAVDVAPDGEEGLYMGLQYPIDMAVIDIGLPKLNGIELVKKLRQQQKTFPILILTARGDWQDKVEGLEAGADDYLVKPFHLEELLARLNALKRRASGMAHAMIEKGPIQVDTNKKSVSLQGEEIALTAYEYRVLEYMMMNPGKIVSKHELTEHIYDEEVDHDSNVIEVFVGRLRKKLDPTSQFKPIETIRGQGYRVTLN
jgi:two-component system response regulator PhoP